LDLPRKLNQRDTTFHKKRFVSSRTVPAAAEAALVDPYAHTLPTGQAVLTPAEQVKPAGQLNEVVYPDIVH